MGARQKLNRAFFNGSVVLACVAGAATGSWLVFGLALVALTVVNFATGEIRCNRRKR